MIDHLSMIFAHFGSRSQIWMPGTFVDIAPKADVHLLFVPEQHFADFREIGVLSADESKRMLEFIAETAKGAGLEEYRETKHIWHNIAPAVQQWFGGPDR